MSIHYMFVDKERDTQLKNMRAILLGEQERLITAINQFSADNPKVAEDADDVVFELRQCSAFGWRQAYEDEHVIGYTSAGKFNWNRTNGFNGIEDVQQFLNDYPGYIIQNDYGDEISIKDFKKICKPK